MRILLCLLMLTAVLSCSGPVSAPKGPQRVVDYNAVLVNEPVVYAGLHEIDTGEIYYESAGIIISSLYEGEMTINHVYFSNQKIDKSGNPIPGQESAPEKYIVKQSTYRTQLSEGKIFLEFLKSHCEVPTQNPLSELIDDEISVSALADGVVAVKNLKSNTVFPVKRVVGEELSFLANNPALRAASCAGGSL